MQNKVKELNNVITQNPPDMKKLQLVLQGSVSVQVWNTRNNATNMGCKHERQCFIGISKHREQIWKYAAQPSIFEEIRGVWIADETLSWVFDIYSQSKQKLTSKKLKTKDFFCFNVMNC